MCVNPTAPCLWVLVEYCLASVQKVSLRGRKETSRRGVCWALLITWKLLVLHQDKHIRLISEMNLEIA